jgi:transposase-like protein
MMNKRKLRTYDKDFKLNAVKLYLANDKPYEQISQELGVPTATLVGWVQDYKKDGAQAFPGKGHVKEEDRELMQLRKELAIVREERDILKKALGIFSSQRK